MKGCTPSGASVVMPRRIAPSMAPWTSGVRREKPACRRLDHVLRDVLARDAPAIVITTSGVTNGDEPHAVKSLPIIV